MTEPTHQPSPEEEDASPEQREEGEAARGPGFEDPDAAREAAGLDDPDAA